MRISALTVNDIYERTFDGTVCLGLEPGNCQPCLRVVNARREDKRGTAPALLVAGLRIKRQPNQIAGVWNVRASYHASWPSGVPQSLSSWRFRGVILATSRPRE